MRNTVARVVLSPMYGPKDAFEFLQADLSDRLKHEVEIKKIPYEDCVLGKRSGFEVEMTIRDVDVKDRLRKLLEKLRKDAHKSVHAFAFTMLHRTRAIVSCKDEGHRNRAIDEINFNYKGDRRELFICSCANLTENADNSTDDSSVVLFQVGFSSPKREEELTNLLEPLRGLNIIEGFYFDKS